MSQKSFVPKGFNTPVNNFNTPQQPTKKNYSDGVNIQEYLLLLSEKLSIMNMKIDNFQSRNERILKDVYSKSKLLSDKIEDLSRVMNDNLLKLIDGNSSISTINDDYTEDNSDFMTDESECSLSEDYESDNLNDKRNKNKKTKKIKLNKSNKEKKDKKDKNEKICDNQEKIDDSDDVGQQPKGIIVKFNGKNNNSFNPLDFLMNLTQSLKPKELPKEIESDDEYDDKFHIYDENDNINIEKNYVNISDHLENINDIISMGEKYQHLLEKNKVKIEDKKEKKKKNIDSDQDSESEDIFDVFDINKSENNVETDNKFCKFYILNGKKYGVNLQKVCNLIQPLKKLNRMIGLKHIKEQLFEMIIYYLQGFENENKNMLHSVIEGPPGVGKTKLGKIMAQIYCALGIIPSNKFKYVKATDMIGDHVGATKHMTQSVIDEADGGVLFIDEAYALSTSDTKDPYGKECMDTLNFNLSENKKKLIVIIAGYPDQLDKCFFSHNPGLQRRFPFRYKVDKYSAKEMSEIFQDKIKKYKWKINKEITEKYLEEFFKKNMDDFKNFGGDIENFFKKCQFSHSKRTIDMHPAFRGKLTIEDINNGLNTFKQNKKKEDSTFKSMFI